MRIVVLCLLSLAWVALQAQVYKTVLPDGTVTYTDRPQPGAEEIKVAPVQTYDAPFIPAGTLAPKEEKKVFSYKAFAVASPANDQALRDNAGNVSISLQLEPELRENHTIEIRVDGKSVGKGRTLAVALSNVDRGSHSVQAVITDHEGKTVITTDAVTFHLLRAAK